MALITEEYRSQQRELHATNPSYGTASVHYAPLVAGIVKSSGVRELLDYGAGKGRLAPALNDMLGLACPRIHHYEPARPEWAAPPPACEMVACIDVLEHIEPDCLNDVLDDLKRVTQRIGLFTVHTGPAVKTLPDGRNAHLIQEPPAWWLPKFFERFDVQAYQKTPGGFFVVVRPW